jgi:hypothetical protein
MARGGWKGTEAWKGMQKEGCSEAGKNKVLSQVITVRNSLSGKVQKAHLFADLVYSVLTKCSQKLILKKSKISKRADKVVQVVEHLPSKPEALSSNPSTEKKKKERKEMIKQKF